MKKTVYPFLLLTIVLSVFTAFHTKQGDEPWTRSQLMEPSVLAETLRNPERPQPVIYCIGPQAIIKNSVDIGPTTEKENLRKLKKELEKLSKDENVVIYCGCCPFSRCPNVRPAFSLLNEMKFKNHKLLNLPRNIKVDWIDKGFPVNN